jgi:hypothetical protein
MNTEFFRKGSPARKHATNSLAGLIAGTVMGTLVPMLQQWHSDKAVCDSITASEMRLQRQLDSFKEDQNRANRAQWEALNRKQDRY